MGSHFISLQWPPKLLPFPAPTRRGWSNSCRRRTEACPTKSSSKLARRSTAYRRRHAEDPEEARCAHVGGNSVPDVPHAQGPHHHPCRRRQALILHTRELSTDKPS